jgi:hypothetical protein
MGCATPLLYQEGNCQPDTHSQLHSSAVIDRAYSSHKGGFKTLGAKPWNALLVVRVAFCLA